jgi:hypothetical protein
VKSFQLCGFFGCGSLELDFYFGHSLWDLFGKTLKNSDATGENELGISFRAEISK